MNRPLDNGETYKTSDINIAAYLKSKFKLAIHDCSVEDNRVFFIFDTKKVDIIKIITDYANSKDDNCSISAFNRELNALKILIRNLMENKKR